MKTRFLGYYRPSQKEFEELWRTAIVVPDTNVLLNFYRYSDATRNRLLGVLSKFKDQIWIPHQVGKEFHANRLQVISEQVEAYKKIPHVLDQHKKQIENELGAYKRHPLIDIREHLKAIESAFDDAKKAMAIQQAKHPNLLDQDTVLEAITTLFEGCVGDPYGEAILKQVYKEGEQRFAQGIPPGFSDAKEKQGDEKFGDLVIWRQMLDQAKATGKPMILVTDDVKEDWWWRSQGKTFGPRPELVEEMQLVAGRSFYMYRTDQFMEYARSNLQEQISEAAISEVRNVRRKAVVARRYAGQLAMAEQLNDFLRNKAALESRQAQLTRRLEDLRDRQAALDLSCNEMRIQPDDLSSRRELVKEQVHVLAERDSTQAELARLSSEITKMLNAVRDVEHQGEHG